MAFLEMRDISKRFPGVVANDHVSLSVERGETHALLGENGAGKSTLMNILYGLYRQDEGEIFLDGKKVEIRDPRHAIALGIGMVHQHFMLIPALTVIENMLLGMKKGGRQLQKAAQEVQALAERYHMSIDPSTKVWQLSVGAQQRLEILKALYRGAQLLILDEPTAVLTPQEVDDLFAMVDRLNQDGHAVIFITHKLGEVMEHCQRCTVLRQGRLAATVRIGEIENAQALARLMVGKDVALVTEKAPKEAGDTVLEVKDLCALNNKKLEALKKVSFSIRSGEILGVAGVDGNGQSELVECLTGLREVTGGAVAISGRDATRLEPRAILEQGVSHIPEDRHRMGMSAAMSIKENLIMMNYYKPPCSRHRFIDWKWAGEYAKQICDAYEVKTPSVEEEAGKLSGGNQQKFVVGRELERHPKLLIAMHPDRGLDIGATKYIQSRIVHERDQGCAVLLVSTELDEILELSDRILVLYEGEVMGILDGKTATREEVGLMMAGSRREAVSSQ